MLSHTDLPKIDNRMGGTPDQNKAIAQGVVAMYGTYTVDEANKPIIVKFEGASFAKFVGTEGWIFVSRGNETVTDSDPVCLRALRERLGARPEVEVRALDLPGEAATVAPVTPGSCPV